MQVEENVLAINTLELKKAGLILRAINHKLRQQMVYIIKNAGSINVTDLYIKLRIEQSVASQHLAILRKAGFVKAVRNKKFVFYQINYLRFTEIEHFTNGILQEKEKVNEVV